MMAWTAEDTAKMDTAAGEAEEDLREKKATWTPEELAGAVKFFTWWHKWFLRAGHKRLCRISERLL